MSERLANGGAPVPPGVVFDRVQVTTPAGRISPEASFEVAPGSHVEIFGPSGIGKGRILATAAGLERPIHGRVLVAGADIAALGYAALQAHRVRTGYVFPRDALLDNQAICDNVALPLRYHRDPGEAEVERMLRAILEELGIDAARGEPPATCAPGVAKLALVARALVLEPSLLLMEEPTTGLTFEEQGVVAAAVRRRREGRGMTVIQTSDDRRAAGIPAERVIDLEGDGDRRGPGGAADGSRA